VFFFSRSIKFLTFHTAGTLRGGSGGGPTHAAAVATVEALPSYRAHEVFVRAGEEVGCRFV
jgi:hypothetical protein